MTPEPKGKLDTMATQTTGGAQATMAVVAVVNGPEDELLDWHAVRWRTRTTPIADPVSLVDRCRPDYRRMTGRIGANLCPQADPPTKVSLLEVIVWFPASEIMVLSQQALQVGTRVSSKWGSYRGESNRI
jgi:hypothetical protein